MMAHLYRDPYESDGAIPGGLVSGADWALVGVTPVHFMAMSTSH
jgi:hypothetical protein